ncbi:MAG: hypothetical protein R2864_06935 [Syntrophotaleaceae bacterium]
MCSRPALWDREGELLKIYLYDTSGPFTDPGGRVDIRKGFCSRCGHVGSRSGPTPNCWHN